MGAVLFLAPLVCAWLAVRYFGDALYNPPGVSGLVLWLLQAAILASIVAAIVDRLARRLLPLKALLGMSLTFPDHAPSRFGVALRAGTLNKLESKVADLSAQDSESTQQAATLAVELVTMLGRHERMTRGHTERVRAYSDLIAQEMKLSEDDRQKLAWAALLHDIGKLSVPAEILNKDTKPTTEEWATLANHPGAGADMLEPLYGWLGEWLLATAEHHERWDGNGYPQQLVGAEISLAGRIVAVADAYDVITSRRSYKQPLSTEAARRELVACAGKQFDPDVVRAMLSASSSAKTRSARFAWLLELPGVTQAWTGLAGAPALTTLGLVAALSGAPSVVPNSTPIEIAFEAPASASPAVTVPAVKETVASRESTTDPVSSATSTTGEIPFTFGTDTTTTSELQDPRSTSTESPTPGSPTADSPSGPITSDPTSTPGSPTPGSPTPGSPTPGSPPTAPPATAAPTTTSPPTTAPPTTAAPTTVPPTTALLSPCQQIKSGDYDNLAGSDLAACDLRGLTLDGLDLSNADLTDADFRDATISNFNLDGATLDDSRFRDAELTDGSFVGVTGVDIDARGLVATRVNFASSVISDSEFSSSRITEASFGFATLSGVDFDEAHLLGVNFNDSTLRSVDFTHATMTGAEFFRAHARTSNFSNVSLAFGRLDDANLSGTIFSGASLANATLHNADLDAVSLSLVDLTGSTGQPLQSDSAIYQSTICPDGSVTNVPSCWP